MTFVVDTNVAVVANGREWLDKAPDCVIACIQQITKIKDSGRIAVDDGWKILKEYGNNLRESGEPGAGDAFFRWVLSNSRNPERCDLVSAAPFPDNDDLRAFDPADRIFVTVALAHSEHPPILQATDSKWKNFEPALAECGVNVRFLCG
jgi:hypothetical protein